MKVNILGTVYTIIEADEAKDKCLKHCDGYCDKTTKHIVVGKPKEDADLGDFEVYKRKVMRHEILHAFLFESGLHENWSHPEFGHDETYLDWFACQFPKIMAVYKKCGCLE